MHARSGFGLMELGPMELGLMKLGLMEPYASAFQLISGDDHVRLSETTHANQQSSNSRRF